MPQMVGGVNTKAKGDSIMDKVRLLLKRSIAMLLVVFTLVTLLPLQAQAGWMAVGGGSGSGGQAGSGKWKNFMQGIRITVIDKNGNPAFYYGDTSTSNSIDLLSSTGRLDEVDIFYGGCKMSRNYKEYQGNGHWDPQKTKLGIGATMNYIDWIVEKFREGKRTNNKSGWRAFVPVETYEQLNRLKTLTPVIHNNKKWSIHGEEIRELIYGSEDQPKPKNSALIYNIMNIYYNETSAPVWSLTRDAINDNNITQEDILNYGRGINCLNPAFLAANPDAYFIDTITMMMKYNFAIVVEPLIWVQFRTSESQHTEYVAYGTPTNIAMAADELHDLGLWKSPNYKYGGYDMNNKK